MKYLAPAKINLFLHILGQADHGYHTLQSLMVFADIGDIVSFDMNAPRGLEVLGLFADLVPDGQDNLILRARDLMERKAGRYIDFGIRLTKNIPVGAGLGGGSADAAALMHALNDMWGRPFCLQQLCEFGLTLGAELPFCLSQQPMLVEGIGEKLTPMPMGSPLHAVLVWPATLLSTREVFLNFAREPQYEMPLSHVSINDLPYTKNDLENIAIRMAPAIGQALAQIAHQPACTLARMTGSGSCCFGLYNSSAAAEASAHIIANAHPEWWVSYAQIGHFPTIISAAI